MNQYLHTLGLSPGVSEADIKRAYRKLAKLYHPDVNTSPDAQRKFVEITEAYNFLIDVGARPHHEEVKYDYDPFRKEYEERRKKAYEYARQKRKQQAEERWHALTMLYSYTNYLVKMILVVNMVLFVDYSLPYSYQREKIVKLAYSYESPNQQGQNLIYRHGTIFFEKHAMLVNREITNRWHLLKPEGNVYVTRLFEVVLKAEVVLGDEPLVLEPVFSIYHFFFFLIPTSIVLIGLYFRMPELAENKIGLVVILVIGFVIQLLVFFVSS